MEPVQITPKACSDIAKLAQGVDRAEVALFALGDSDLTPEQVQRLEALLKRVSAPSATTPPAVAELKSSDTYQQDSQVSELIQRYNQDPGRLQGIGVSETSESFGRRRLQSNVDPVLHQVSNPSFRIVEDRYLVPRPGSKVTTHMCDTFAAVFECQNFSSGAPFQLIEPAIVSTRGNNQWELVQRGKLKFL